MSVVPFKISGADAVNVDATNNFTTDAYEFDTSHDWSVSIKDNGVVGLPTYTIEVSNNNVTWYDFNLDSTDVALADSVTTHYFGFRYMRIVYSANGSSAGTVDVELGLLNNTRNQR